MCGSGWFHYGISRSESCDCPWDPQDVERIISPEVLRVFIPSHLEFLCSQHWVYAKLLKFGWMNWWEQLVNCQLECIIKHPWYQYPEEFVTLLETWICVDLDQPRIEEVVNHEIVPKDLEAELSIILVHFLTDRCQGELHDWHHSLPQYSVEVYINTILLH